MTDDLAELDRALRQDPESNDAAHGLALALRRQDRGIEGTVFEEWLDLLGAENEAICARLQRLGSLAQFAVPALARRLLKETRSKSTILETLASIGDVGLLALIDQLGHRSLREDIIRQLKSNKHKALPLLIERMGDPNSSSVPGAAAVFLALGDGVSEKIACAMRDQVNAPWLLAILDQIGEEGAKAIEDLVKDPQLYSLWLTFGGPKKIGAIKQIRTVQKVGLRYGKDFFERVPAILAISKNKAALKEMMPAFEELGAKLEIR
ncbi:MAG: ribosomal protein L7/L12 [Planctomycetota bacterium]|nr:ribosomal protein L7/L12 [Planctomycetota bacterium]